MYNCSVTRLSEVANDNNLEFFDSVLLRVYANESAEDSALRCITIINTEEFSIKVLNDENYIKSGNSEYVSILKNLAANTAHQVYLKNEDFNILITNKYNIKAIGTSASQCDCVGFDLSTINDLTKLQTITLSNASHIIGDFANLKGINSLVTLNIPYSNCYGDIASAGSSPLLTTLGISYNTNASGKVGGITSPVEDLKLRGTSITGSLERFVSTQCGAGRTTGTCLVNSRDGHLTFAGVLQDVTASLEWEPNATAGRTTVSFNGISEVIDTVTGEIVS